MDTSPVVDAQRQRPSLIAVVGGVVAVLCLVGVGRLLFHQVRGRAQASEAPAVTPTAAPGTPSAPTEDAAALLARRPRPLPAPFEKTPFHPWLDAAQADARWWTSPTEGGREAARYGAGRLLPVRKGLGQTTVLLMGVDARPEQDEGPWQTDTLMLLMLDPQTGRAGVLSIPRDLWVPIPGHDTGRINTAAYLGAVYHPPDGGPALAMETVATNFGVPIDHYARVNFQGFVEVVDLIGGIDVHVEQAIDDPYYPELDGETYSHLQIAAGDHHFDGEMALKYVRTRYARSDFDRARRQQQVLRAVLRRVVDLQMLPELAGAAPELYATLQASVQTDMSLDKLLRLATAASRVERDRIRFGVIDASCTRPWVTPHGGQVLLPRWREIRRVRDAVFGSEAPSEAP
jgi:LCP family protein required for cell wall assembly